MKFCCKFDKNIAVKIHRLLSKKICGKKHSQRPLLLTFFGSELEIDLRRYREKCQTFYEIYARLELFSYYLPQKHHFFTLLENFDGFIP